MAKSEIDKAVQNLITMTGKKVEIKKVWANASPNSMFVSQEIPANIVPTACDWVVVIAKVKVGSDVDSMVELTSFFRSGENGIIAVHGTISGRKGTADRRAVYGSGKPKRYTISSANYFNDLVNTNNDNVCIPLAIYTVKGVV